MRSIGAALAARLALLAVAGCGSSDGDAPPAATQSSVFPVSVTHRLGTTTVPAEPRRIAVVGLTEQDIVLALGEKPIATTEWYGEQPYAVWPWARRALGTAKPTVLSNSQNAFYDGQLYLYPDGLNTEFLTYLGLEINPKVTALAKRPGEQVPISAEQLPILDSDELVFATEEAKDVPALMKVKLFPRIPAVAGNRAVYTDATLSGAMYFVSPLSLPYVLDKLVPQLDAALDGRAPRSIASG